MTDRIEFAGGIKSRWEHADVGDRNRAAHVPYGRTFRLEFDTEEAYGRDEEFHDALVRVTCPHCRRVHAPLMSASTRHLASDWRWVGLEYKEPFSEWLCVCPRTGRDYVLTTHTPQ